MTEANICILTRITEYLGFLQCFSQEMHPYPPNTILNRRNNSKLGCFHIVNSGSLTSHTLCFFFTAESYQR